MTLQVLFIDLKSYYPSPPYQMGLLISAARLEHEVRSNVRFTIREAPRDEAPGDIVRDVLQSRYDLIAVSCYAWNHKNLCSVLEGLEASDTPLPPILVGGPNAVGEFGESLMRDHPSITAMVEGEGEPAFQDICNGLVDSPSRDLFQGGAKLRHPGRIRCDRASESGTPNSTPRRYPLTLSHGHHQTQPFAHLLRN